MEMSIYSVFLPFIGLFEQIMGPILFCLAQYRFSLRQSWCSSELILKDWDFWILESKLQLLFFEVYDLLRCICYLNF